MIAAADVMAVVDVVVDVPEYVTLNQPIQQDQVHWPTDEQHGPKDFDETAR